MDKPYLSLVLVAPSGTCLEEWVLDKLSESERKVLLGIISSNEEFIEQRFKTIALDILKDTDESTA